MLPCPAPQTLKKKEDDKGENHSKLLWFEHRFLSGGETSSTQCKEGYEELISAEALHQLHILIFFLAIFHVLYVQNLSAFVLFLLHMLVPEKTSSAAGISDHSPILQERLELEMILNSLIGRPVLVSSK
uniref:MLO-like protein 8 n=1 Tax=Noccaea caerulescens TaxID=107243 RepID=A0A1J3DNX2_NOCCA